MKHRWIASWSAAALFTVGLSLPTSYAVGADTDITDRVENAKTAADHEAIAKYYDGEAADAKKRADVRRKMAKTYSVGGGIGKGIGPVPFPQHCQAIAKDADDEASHYTAMAEMHRQLAKSGK